MSKGQISKFVKKLGYESYFDFKDACIEYLEAQIQKKQIFRRELNLEKNVAAFTDQYRKMLQFIEKKLDYKKLNQLIRSILQHKRNLSFCTGRSPFNLSDLQIELGNLTMPIGINNTDFPGIFCYDKDIMILLISINGRSFVFNKSIIRKILDMSNETWVITCNQDIVFPENKLIVPTEDGALNEYAVRFVIDIIIAELKKGQPEKQ